jgi:hypothetical protein
LQVRALHICGHEETQSSQEGIDALEELLQEARRIIARRAGGTISYELYIELFFADCIFEPGSQSVHGDFTSVQLSSAGMWPQNSRQSGKGPYGSTGLHGREERPFQRIEEEEFLQGVGRQLYSLSTCL